MPPVCLQEAHHRGRVSSAQTMRVARLPSQVAPGPATLLNPEKGLLVLGHKSYGRGSAFLLKIGHEQVALADLPAQRWHP